MGRGREVTPLDAWVSVPFGSRKTDEVGNVLRQVELYDGGQRLRYDESGATTHTEA